MMMYGRNGAIEVSDLDAVTTTTRHPSEWTLQPWIRPDHRPDVWIRPDWDQMGVADRIALARTTVNGRGLEIETVAQADQAISEYLAGTKHPGEANS